MHVLDLILVAMLEYESTFGLAICSHIQSFFIAFTGTFVSCVSSWQTQKSFLWPSSWVGRAVARAGDAHVGSWEDVQTTAEVLRPQRVASEMNGEQHKTD